MASKRTMHRTFRVSFDEWDALNRIAAENDMAVATLIRHAIGEFVADYSESTYVLTTFPVNTPAIPSHFRMR